VKYKEKLQVANEILAEGKRASAMTDEQLLDNFEKGKLTGFEYPELMKRGFRDELLRRCDTKDERIEVWYESFAWERVLAYASHLQPPSMEEAFAHSEEDHARAEMMVSAN
jgi:hypothetical protein